MSNNQTPMYVYSTLASSVRYVNHKKVKGNDLPQPEGEGVLIHGGAGVPDKARLETPHGVVTTVTAEDVEYLNRNPVFVLHQANGFIKVDMQLINTEAAAGDMNANDESRALVESDLVDPDGDPDEQPVISVGSAGTGKKGGKK